MGGNCILRGGKDHLLVVCRLNRDTSATKGGYFRILLCFASANLKLKLIHTSLFTLVENYPQFKFDASNTAATGSLCVCGHGCSGPFMGAVVMGAATATFCLWSWQPLGLGSRQLTETGLRKIELKVWIVFEYVRIVCLCLVFWWHGVMLLTLMRVACCRRGIGPHARSWCVHSRVILRMHVGLWIVYQYMHELHACRCVDVNLLRFCGRYVCNRECGFYRSSGVRVSIYCLLYVVLSF